MTVVPFKAEHLRRMKLQPSQRCCAPLLTEEMVARVAQLEGYTALVNDAPVAIAGVMEFLPGRFAGWAFVAENAGRHMLAITRAIYSYFRLHKPGRLETFVDDEFEQGHRWAATLGFVPHGQAADYFGTGRMQRPYVRIAE